MALDRELLIKLLNMTASKHDGEVLSAIRKSNDLLRRSNLNWADLVNLPAPLPDEKPMATARARSHASASDMRSSAGAPRSGRQEAGKAHPILTRIPLSPFRMIAKLFAGRATPGQTKVMKTVATVTVFCLYLICLGFAVAMLTEAFRL